jgi:hypothetical protein
MDVNFTIDDFGNEAEALAAAAAGLAPEEEEYLWGTIEISHPGQPKLTLRDDLLPLAGPLFGTVVERLRRSEPVDLGLTAWPGHFAFMPSDDGETVRITGPGGQDASYPRQDLLAALAACGARLLACVRALAEVSPQYGPAADALATELASA